MSINVDRNDSNWENVETWISEKNDRVILHVVRFWEWETGSNFCKISIDNFTTVRHFLNFLSRQTTY